MPAGPDGRAPRRPRGLVRQDFQSHAALAARQLRGAIVDGELKPGQRLIEVDLCEQLGMSRHPVREALRILSRDGLVTLRPNRGAVVAELSASEVLEVYEIRRSLGSLALRHLVANGAPAPAALTRLEELAGIVVAAAEHDQEKMVVHDLLFQVEIAVAAGLPKVAEYFKDLGTDIQRFINITGIRYPHREATARREVLGLFEAIRDGDLGRAETIWQGKFETAAERLVAMLRTEGHSHRD